MKTKLCEESSSKEMKNSLESVAEEKLVNKEENPKIRDAMTSILKLFEMENLEVFTQAVFKAPEGYNKPSDNWSFLNRVLMFSAGTSDARGFQQWRSAERHVSAGKRAITIFGPLMKKIQDPKTQEEKMILYGFNSIPVFRFQDTEGKELPQAPPIVLNIPCQFDGILKELDLKTEGIYFSNGLYGFYSPLQKTIGLATPEISTFLHELSHAVDDKLHGIKTGQRGDQEVIAEFSASVVGALLGYKVPFGNSKKYIENYSFAELTRNLNRSEKVIDFIIERTQIKEIEKGATAP
ncbi:MAG: antirestriction protein [Nanoarchaeota archaeon]|nr:antirestriction protein [Nanoarchaeota archaeon]MBU4300822.1 antirestriction protein [Nanoarchaeota archaeon]MBU4451497.1 antirestriction protein [Nanoarchaeota archaeon]MCG2723852.1 antirestriction protein [archaeon]